MIDRNDRVLRGAVIGVGYFSHFHFDAWRRIENVDIVAVCDLDEQKANAVAAEFGVEKTFTEFRQMLDSCELDFVDIVTRPDSHLAIATEIAARGIAIICQKPAIDCTRSRSATARGTGTAPMLTSPGNRTSKRWKIF